MSRNEFSAEPAAPVLGDECEAFLAGSYAARAGEWGWPIPAWAWVNLLAHSSESELRRIADAGPPSSTDPAARRWWLAVSRLAGRVLQEVERSGLRLQFVQDVLLGTLESWLLDIDPTAQISAERLTALVLATLYGHPCARQ